MGDKHNFYGTATVGTKGQIVIPQEAREDLDIKTGDKLVIVGVHGRKMMCVLPVESIEGLMADLTEKLNGVKQIIKKTKEK